MGGMYPSPIIHIINLGQAVCLVKEGRYGAPHTDTYFGTEGVCLPLGRIYAPSHAYTYFGMGCVLN